MRKKNDLCNNKKKMQSQLLRVNSKFRNDPDNTTTTNFTYSLGSTQATESVKRIELISFNCSRLFYNIGSYNNSITVRDGFGSEDTARLTPNHYSVESLVTELNRVCVFVTSVGTVHLTFTIVGDRLAVARDTTNAYIIVTSESSIAPYIGLTSYDFSVTTTPTPLPSLTQLEGPDPIYVQSFTICSGGCLDAVVLGGLIPLVGCIDCSQVGFGYNVAWKKTAPDMFYTEWAQGISIKTIDIKLCDMYGNLLELPGNNIDCDLIFRIQY